MTPQEYNEKLHSLEEGTLSPVLLMEVYKILDDALARGKFIEEEKEKIDNLIHMEMDIKNLQIEYLQKMIDANTDPEEA